LNVHIVISPLIGTSAAVAVAEADADPDSELPDADVADDCGALDCAADVDGLPLGSASLQAVTASATARMQAAERTVLSRCIGSPFVYVNLFDDSERQTMPFSQCFYGW
jgi:hypothetical protein